MVESGGNGMRDVIVADIEGQKREDDRLIEMAPIGGDMIRALRKRLMGPTRRRAQSSIYLKAIGRNCILVLVCRIIQDVERDKVV